MSYLKVNIDFDTVCNGERNGNCGNYLFQKWASISKKLLLLHNPKSDTPGTQNCVIIAEYQMR